MFKDSNFDSEYRPSKNVSIDEAMIPFKGRLSLKQYMPLKPVKRGIKVWECADSSNGFVCDLEVYTGKQRNGNPEQGLGHRVVKFFVDVSIVHAYILEKLSPHHQSRTQLAFRLDLVKLLIGNFSAQRLSASSGRLEGGHWPIKFSKGRCKRCLKRNKETWCRMACELCGKRICLDCFKDSNFDRIAEETNRYARHAMETKPDPAWRETDAEEVPEVQKIFPRNHFAKISQYLHLNGN